MTDLGDPRIDKAAAIKAVCDRHGIPLAAAAMQFPLHHPAGGSEPLVMVPSCIAQSAAATRVDTPVFAT